MMTGGELPPTISSAEGDADAGVGGDLVGRVLGGRYRILRKLGEGAMGAVYLGEHLKIGRQDAIKVLRDSLATDADTIARFVRGTRNVSMIRHPNICTIYDYSDVAGGTQFVAMEFVPGETLRDLLQREGRLPIDTAVHVAVQAAEALDAAHEVGIVHRDLKPANIMVVPGRSGKLDVKVVDFDIAKGSSDGEGEEVTRMGFVVGTPEYMSPEQLIGEKLDGRSDVYSLALVLYRMLTGTLPFAAQDTQDLMVKRLTEEPLSLIQGLPGGRFPDALEAAVRKALQRKPADRQPTAAEFGREIRLASEHPATVGATGYVPLPPLERRTGASGGGRAGVPRVALVGGGVALVALVALAAIAAALMTGDPELPLADAPAPVADPAQVVLYDDPTVGEAPPTGDPAAAAGSVTDQGGTSGSGAAPVGPADEVPLPQRAPPMSQQELVDLMDSIVPGAPVSTLAAVQNTARTEYEHPDASAVERATAAYVAGSAAAELGDVQQAADWLQRAVDLRPGFQAYTSLLRTYQQQLSGGY